MMTQTDPRTKVTEDGTSPAAAPLASGSGGADPAGAPGPRGKRRRVWPVALLVALALLIGFYVGSFIRFADAVARLSAIDAPEAAPQADAIVVLTGGSERVKIALDLLAEGRAERLLISGVHPDTTPRQIVSLTESDMALFDCCVDLDRNANNTLENASETAKWAHDGGYTSLLVVTSAYHMPRALLELRSAADDVDLIPVAVQANGMEFRRWYLDPQVSLLLLREQLKYMLSWLRIVMSTGRLPG